MELALESNVLCGEGTVRKAAAKCPQNLTQGEVNRPYIIKGIATEEKSMQDFLFTLGCFAGEKIIILSILAENYIIHVKDARYSIDLDLAKTILI
jgi:ferrous iron transport protein A